MSIKIRPLIKIKDTLQQDIKNPEHKFIQQASTEQQTIVDLVRQGHNVRVTAVAGAGKTTTVLHIANSLPTKKILLITYNRRLKDESALRALNLGAYNLQVETYHSCASKLYKHVSNNHNDTLMEIINHDMSTSAIYDYIVVDEIQDMTDLLYRLTKKIIKDTLLGSLVVLGDPHQCIYRSVGADPHYLTDAHLKFEREFVDATLSTSYRVTRQVAQLVNASIGYERIQTVKGGPNVIYLAGDIFGSSNIIFDMLNRLLGFSADSTSVYNPDDVFILGYSVKKNEGRDKPIHKLENTLVKARYPVFRPLDDNININQDDVKGKICISSFHQSKGRERKIVIVYGHDDNYFRFSGREKDVNDGLIDPYSCPNEVYVALTRAQERLIIVGGTSLPPWLQKLPREADVIGYCQWKPYKSSEYKQKSTTPTDLVKFIPDHVLMRLKDLTNKLIKPSSICGTYVNLTSVLNLQRNNVFTTESVSDITGLAIAAMYETHCTKDMPTIHKYITKRTHDCKSVAEFLQTAVEYESQTSGYLNRLHQITRYDWTTSAQCQTMLENIKLHVPQKDLRFEVGISTTYDSIYGPLTVSGRVDILDQTSVYELKATTELTLEHQLQLIIYGWLFRDRRMKLVNARTGECHEICNDTKIVNEIVNILLDVKYGTLVIDTNMTNSISPFNQCLL